MKKVVFVFVLVWLASPGYAAIITADMPDFASAPVLDQKTAEHDRTPVLALEPDPYLQVHLHKLWLTPASSRQDFKGTVGRKTPHQRRPRGRIHRGSTRQHAAIAVVMVEA